ncbi:vomeronasal type-2 receptor 26-like [Ascaphus truei]|uniref:vomeronasal type-2 receptor 26-like n=1 Tax=Ascaphus truei TaxID=8439 RepID=UPI003F5AD144
MGVLPNYIKEGDILLGGVLQLYYARIEGSSNRFPPSVSLCEKHSIRFLRHFLAFDFAVREINENMNILPNITLGYEIFDSCYMDVAAVEGTMRVLSGRRTIYPNYNCHKNGTVVAFIGHLLSSPSQAMLHFLQVYRYPQISYGAMDSIFNDRKKFPLFFRTVPTDLVQNAAILHLLKHFGWTWVGIVTTNDDSNQRASEELRHEIITSGNCVAYLVQLSLEDKSNWKIYYERALHVIGNSSAQVIITYLTFDYRIKLFEFMTRFQITTKVLILPATVSVANNYQTRTLMPALNGSLMFSPPKGNIPGLKEFLYRASPSIYPNNRLIKDLWRATFKCNASLALKRKYICTDNQSLSLLSTSDYDVDNFRLTYSVYTAVYALAHSLHNLYSTYFHKQKIPVSKINTLYPGKLAQYLKHVHFKTPSGDEIFFDEKGSSTSKLDLLNYVIYPNQTSRSIQVGQYRSSTSHGQQLLVNDRDIMWGLKKKGIPRSVCSDSCSPGYRKAAREGQSVCCYDCVPCSKGTISNMTDMANCLQCPEDAWPDEKKVMCVKKTLNFLSFQEPLGLALTTLSVTFCIGTFSVLVVFIIHRDTPIVKANNRDLSYTLLISLMLCFLCPLLFIGQPTMVTCLLRRAAFCVIFTLAVSSVLGKTIIVFVAFKSTKPGSKLKKWVGKRLSSSVVLICSLVELGICLVSLGHSPPFPDRDTKTETGKIILLCNEGSIVGFYIRLGYIGFLALASFIVAFMVRKLPDHFNEARNITFSMMVFCTVWVTFIPAYETTKGKTMVAVEIFAILASSAGLLGCIFISKCYTIMIKSYLNIRETLLGRIRNYPK